MRLAHAIGFGMTLTRTIGLELPSREDWTTVINLVIEAFIRNETETTETDHDNNRTNQSLEEYANDPERITEYSVWNDDVTLIMHRRQRRRYFYLGLRQRREPRLTVCMKAKTSQWNGQTDLDWSIEVDPYTMLYLQIQWRQTTSKKTPTPSTQIFRQRGKN